MRGRRELGQAAGIGLRPGWRWWLRWHRQLAMLVAGAGGWCVKPSRDATEARAQCSRGVAHGPCRWRRGACTPMRGAPGCVRLAQQPPYPRPAGWGAWRCFAGAPSSGSAGIEGCQECTSGIEVVCKVRTSAPRRSAAIMVPEDHCIPRCPMSRGPGAAGPTAAKAGRGGRGRARSGTGPMVGGAGPCLAVAGRPGMPFAQGPHGAVAGPSPSGPRPE